MWDETGRKRCKGEKKKLLNWAQSNSTKSKILLKDWNGVLAFAQDSGWQKEVNDMARVSPRLTQNESHKIGRGGETHREKAVGPPVGNSV